MNDLTEQMRAATAAPPPSTLDLDGFIAREQRRTRLLRWSGGSGAVALLVAAVLAVPALYAGDGGTGLTPGLAGPRCPTPGPNPTEVPQDPAEPGPSPLPLDRCAETAARLGTALRAALAGTAPRVTATPRTPEVFVYQPRYAQYEADFALAGAAGTGGLRVEVKVVPDNPPTEQQVCPPGQPGARKCSYRITRSGTVLFTYDANFSRKAEAYLRDGTLITASAGVPVPEGTKTHEVAPPPLTTDHLLALVQWPGLRLLPGVAASPPPPGDPATEALIDTIVLNLRRKLPDGAFAQPPVPGSPENGLRAWYEAGGLGVITAEVAGTCVDPGAAAECDREPCPEQPDSVYCVVDTDGTRIVGAHGSATLFTPAGRVFTVTAEGALAQRLTNADLAVIAQALAATPPR
ncbi:hypothetical protein [Catellatospora sp. NPDC049609]|uniref:hypothetical protein n=1 Tax=Catellatospora sp. NPDC049609 TaxID=3155505 RepID=UPI00342F02AA